MKLHERLPDSVTAGGRTYRVDLDFRNVLRMIEVIGRKDLLPAARDWRALRCVMRRPPKDAGPVLDALRGMLFSEKKRREDGQKLTDLAQDADLIRAAFWQCYGVNLWRDRLHWFEFSALLSGLPEGCRYSDVIGIRARPMPEPTKYNAKERQWLAKAKADLALEMSENEIKSRYAAGLHTMTMGLLALAGKEGLRIGE